VASQQANKAIKNMNQSLSAMKEKTAGFSGVLDKLKSNWVAIAGVAMSSKVAFDLAKDAAEYNQSVQAMERQFQVSSTVILGKLREVSDGTISNKDLVLAANRAMALGVTMSTEKMAAMLKIARVKARVMGITTTQAFEDIATGIGRNSPLILDNLGIITKGWTDEAKAKGQAFDAQFILNKIMADSAPLMKRMGELGVSEAESFQKLKASWDNATTTLGQMLLPLVLKLTNGLIDLITWVTDLAKSWRKLVVDMYMEFSIFVQKIHVNITSIKIWMEEFAAGMVESWVYTINNIIEYLNQLEIVEIEKVENFMQLNKEKSDYLLATEQAKLKALQDMQRNANKQEADQILLHNKTLSEIEKKNNAEKLKAEAAKNNASVKLTKDKTNKEGKLEGDLVKTKQKLRGMDMSAYSNYVGFMLASLNKNSKKQFYIWKAFAIQRAIISTRSAAISAFSALSGIPVVGPALGAAAAASAIAFGMQQVGMIASSKFQGAEQGALIRGTPTGSLLVAGERNKNEMIIPFENEEAMEKIGGLGDNIVINFNMENLIADEDLPESIINKIDEGLYRLQQEKQSRL
jgi:hypothetical protein